ncbi:PASTA domain-containing protein [Prolixibacteraceae bacterium JC049]|nr:PASTA domain-containing protein [Prolixibacteraceae bacterium JC049]
MSFKQFIFSITFLKHLIIAAVLVGALLWGTLQALDVYTHHGEKVVVPNLKGLTLSQVKKATSNRTLRFAIIDSSYSKKAKPGSVMGQKPEAGFEVKQNRTIYLTMAAVNPEKVSMPNLTDVSLRQAKTMLDGVGLALDSVIYKPSQYVGLVLDQMLADKIVTTGDKVLKGAGITLVVGEGLSNELVALPNLAGMHVEQARDSLMMNGLSLGVLIYDDSFRSAEDSVNAKIWRQKPDSLQQLSVKKGTIVDCWLTVDSLKIMPKFEN